MNTFESQIRLNQITEKAIGCAHQVSNVLGSGFLEKVYENALAMELRQNGLHVEQQRPIHVLYRNTVVGDFQSDLLVENSVILELKAVKSLEDIHAAQCINYLKATGLKVCLLINFGKPRLDIRRIVLNL